MEDPLTAVAAVSQAYDRRVSPALMHALQGPLAGILAFRALDPVVRDVQLRRQPWGQKSWASLYLGLTSVLDVDERGDKFRLRAHKTHRRRGHFDPAWHNWQSLADLASAWPDVEGYLERIQYRIDKKWLDAEGRVHALISNARGSALSVINREASHAFLDTPERQKLINAWRAPLDRALLDHDDATAWWAAMRTVPFGTSPDFVATDAAGRLLVVEAKPASATKGIARGPAQVAFYAAMWQAWLSGPQGSPAVLEEELAQRRALGLVVSDRPLALERPLRVVPVLAVGPGFVSPAAWPRLQAVATAVATAHPSLEPLEVLVFDADGVPTAWDWQPADAMPPATQREHVEKLPFAQRAALAAAQWRSGVLLIDDDGPHASPYLVPAEKAASNLLPEAQQAMPFFTSRGIAWHGSVAKGPTNNLLSSQVQCVNALFPMAQDQDRLKRAFGALLDMAEVEPIDDDSLVTFEYVGPGDLLGEASGGGRTAVDAAFRYRQPDGARALALIEWKYTESYFGTRSKGGKLYRDLWLLPDGPLLTAELSEGPLAYDDVLVEPFYQLVRQQLLAWRIEQSGHADVVRVVHVSPAANTAYQLSLPRPEHRLAGSTVQEVWGRILRRPDRFLSLDSGVFLDPQVTSREYVERYKHA